MSWMYSSASFSSAGVTGECWKIWSHTWAQLCTDAMTFSALDQFDQPTYSRLLFKIGQNKLSLRETVIRKTPECQKPDLVWYMESTQLVQWELGVTSICAKYLLGQDPRTESMDRVSKAVRVDVEVIHHSKVSAAYWCHCMTYQLLWQTTRLLVSTGWVYVLSHANCPVMDDVLIIPDISDRQRGWTLQAVQVQSTWTLLMVPCR